MEKTNQIGIESTPAKKLAALMNDLLAAYQLFYINARGFHWNIAGEKFFELHVKFEEIYNDALIKIDEIAERIRTLGYVPVHSFTEYVKISVIPEITGVSDGVKGIGHVLQGLQSLISIEREILVLSSQANDEGTNALMSDYLREQEKLVWMYSAFLK